MIKRYHALLFLGLCIRFSWKQIRIIKDGMRIEASGSSDHERTVEGTLREQECS